MKNNDYENIIRGFFDGTIEYNTNEWVEAEEALGKIDDFYENPMEILYQLSLVGHFSTIIALSFALSNTISRELLKDNACKSRAIFRNIIDKNCFTASINVLEVYGFFLEEKIDYIYYIKIIKSKNDLESQKAIAYLIYLNDNDYKKLSDCTTDLDFSLFTSDNIFKHKIYVANKIQQKIYAAALYKKGLSRKEILKLFQIDYELFNFVYLWLRS